MTIFFYRALGKGKPMHLQFAAYLLLGNSP
jgi:hypothetical protein